MPSRALLLTTVIVSLLSGKTLHAAGAGPPEPAPVTSPPRPIADPGVGYPRAALQGGRRDRVEVELLLLIDDSGAVFDATVERTAGEPFDKAALEAARRLRFEPARQAGAPVSARIRYRYTFEPPAPALAGTVVDAVRGVPIPGATVTVHLDGGAVRTAVTGPDGRWTAPDVVPGAARVVVTADASLPQEQAIALAPGAGPWPPPSPRGPPALRRPTAPARPVSHRPRRRPRGSAAPAPPRHRRPRPWSTAARTGAPTSASAARQSSVTIMRLGAQQLLRTPATRVERIREQAEALARGTDRIHRIVDAILLLSSLQRGPLELTFESSTWRRCLSRSWTRPRGPAAGRLSRARYRRRSGRIESA